MLGAGAPACNTAVIKLLAGKAGKARKALAELEAKPDSGELGGAGNTDQGTGCSDEAARLAATVSCCRCGTVRRTCTRPRCACRQPRRPTHRLGCCLGVRAAGFERDDAFLARSEAGGDAAVFDVDAVLDEDGAEWSTDSATITETQKALQQVCGCHHRACACACAMHAHPRTHKHTLGPACCLPPAPFPPCGPLPSCCAGDSPSLPQPPRLLT